MKKYQEQIQSVKGVFARRFDALSFKATRFYTETHKGLSNYFKSASYEEDLDSIISALHSHLPNKPQISLSDDFKKRLSEKQDHIVSQALKLIGAGALSGAWVAIESGHFPMISEYALIGAAGSVVIIVMTATGIVVKRLTQDDAMDFKSTSKILDKYINKA